MTYEVVKKVFRQHGSVAVVLPLYLRRTLNINQGDYVVFEVEDDKDQTVIFSKLDLEARRHDRDKRNSG